MCLCVCEYVYMYVCVCLWVMYVSVCVCLCLCACVHLCWHLYLPPTPLSVLNLHPAERLGLLSVSIKQSQPVGVKSVHFNFLILSSTSFCVYVLGGQDLTVWCPTV